MSLGVLEVFPSLVTGPSTSLLFFKTVSISSDPGYPQTHRVTKGDLEHLLLSLPPNDRISGMCCHPGFQHLFLRLPSEITALCVLGTNTYLPW